MICLLVPTNADLLQGHPFVYVQGLKANGMVIPDCQTCKSNCQMGIFLEKDVQAMAIKKTQKDDLQACQFAPDVEQCTIANLGNLLSSSVKNGIKSL